MIRRTGDEASEIPRASPVSPLAMESRVVLPDREQARARRERFGRNAAWLEAHAVEVFDRHRGKCICIAGEELFVADTPEEVLGLASAAHPEDDGYYLRSIYREKAPRIYANRRVLARL